MTLKEFFTVHNKIALGFSGGVDSSFYCIQLLNMVQI